MVVRRADYVQFTNWFSVAAPGTDYEKDPWFNQPAPALEEGYRVLAEFGCDIYDVFRPVRDPKLVTSEVQDGVLALTPEVLSCLSCSLCKGVCRDTMAVKECCHRFCNSCIQRWLRSGKQTCPECNLTKIPSRRVLRADKTLDNIIGRIFPDSAAISRFNKAHNVGAEVAESEANSSDASSLSETEEEPEIEDSSSVVLSEDDEEEDEEIDNEDFEEEEEEEDLPPRVERRGRRPSVGRPPLQRMVSKVPPNESYVNSMMDDLYADESGCLEIFLVCLNHNLPAAVCSMARELSKRPMKLPVGATTRDAAMILAEKLVRDVLGPFDVHSIIPDLSFVRDGEIWPAISDVPLSEVCRQVTESRGPIALRYLLSDRLFSLCERIEAAY